MIPIKLRISGFLSYRDPVELDFTTFELACISGHNGAGKSSLLDAMTWALFGQARKRDDSIINSAAQVAGKAAEVALDFRYEDNCYRIQRSKAKDKPTLLEFFVWQPGATGGEGAWKPLTEKSVRETEARIQSTLRMDYETFINASFFLQGKADQFAQQRPGDRKRILASILGLDAWEEYRERAVDQRKGLELQVGALDGQLREIESELAEGPQRKARLAELKTRQKELRAAREQQSALLDSLRKIVTLLEHQREQVDGLARQLRAASATRDTTQARLAERLSERHRYSQEVAQAETIQVAHAAWQAARESLRQWDEVAQRYQHEQPRRAPIETQIAAERARLEQEIKQLSVQAQEAAHLEANLPGLRADQVRAQQALAEANARLQRRELLQQQRDALVHTRAGAYAENPRLKAEMDELKERMNQLVAVEGADCPLCGQPLSADERQSLIESLQTRGTEMGDRWRENRALLADFDNQIQALDGERVALSTAENDLRTANRQADALEQRISSNEAQLAQWQGEGAPRLAELTTCLRQNDFAAAARAELAKVDAELLAIGYDAAAHSAARQAELDGRASEQAMRELEKAQASLAPLEREVDGLQKQLEEQQQAAERLQAEYDHAYAAYSQAAAQAPDVDRAENAFFELQEQENGVTRELGAAQQQVDILERLRERKKTLDAQREDQTRLIARLRQLERAFGKDGVPALLIEQALPEIEDQANAILERLSGGMMSVRFLTQKEYRDKQRDDKKETLDIQISDGAGMRDYEMFSGGEAFRVNFAIRLALSKVLAQRAGARLQTLVIDEGFGSQDVEGRQRLIEAINLVREDFAKILVITHLEELKEAFPNRIEVEKTDRGSTVQVV